MTERFDRLVTPAGVVRVHQEDGAQALGVEPRRKYESEGGPTAGALGALIRSVSSAPADDTFRFAQALVFNALVGGTDAHARNYALLLGREEVRLAPLFDLNSWGAFGPLPTARPAMSIGGESRVGALAHHRVAQWSPEQPLTYTIGQLGERTRDYRRVTRITRRPHRTAHTPSGTKVAW